MTGGIAGSAIGGIEDEFDALANLPQAALTARLHRFERRLRWMVQRHGEKVIFISGENRNVKVSALAVIRTLRAEDLVGDVELDDISVIALPTPTLAPVFNRALEKNDYVVRWPAIEGRERAFQFRHRPAALGVDGIDLIYRGIAAG